MIDTARPAAERLCPAGSTVWAADGVASAYQAVEWAGAPPRRLRTLLYDGAIRLCLEARAALDDGDAELAGDRLARARRRVQQLREGLRADTPGQGAFAELYEHVDQRLVEADFYRRREAVTETLDLLSGRRPAWSELACGLDAPGVSCECTQSWVG